MTNLTSPRMLWIKGGLFLLLGCLSAAILLSQMQSITSAVLLCLTIWAFCRTYYFAFYVIEHYVDSSFRFAGLVDFAKYALLKSPPDRRAGE